MLSDCLYKKGQDRFENYKFSGKTWSAPCLENPKEIKALLDSFDLVGRRIKKMRFIGLNYRLVQDGIENSVYTSLSELPEEERQKRSDYKNIAPEALFARCAEIDEPLLIMFEDEDVFEIDTPQEPIFCMSMNRIPWWIDAGTNLPNVHADVLFSPCLGKEITDVEVHTYKTNKHPFYRYIFDGEPFEREFVGNIVLRFEDGSGLSIGGWSDYTLVQHIDSNNTETAITWDELQPGLFNWEDLHHDSVTGYEAESPSLFFGSKGAAHAKAPFMSLSTESSESVLHIPVDQFSLLGWCFAKITNVPFDEYGEYHFTYEQWHNILSEANYILVIPTFDELFDYVVGWNIHNYQGRNYMLMLINCLGAAYWKERNRYRTQLEDITNWTSFVMRPNDKMNICGFFCDF